MLTKGTWKDVRKRINDIAKTEKSYLFDRTMTTPDVLRFSTNGLSQLGNKAHFPAAFLNDLIASRHTELANEIVRTKMDDLFTAEPDKELFFREFAEENGSNPTIHGVLTSRYSVFDDKEAADILESSEYLMNAEEVWYDISADQFHARFISPERLHIKGDKSDLSMCVFVDNSMVGLSMFKIRFGLYRWACTNGMISDFKEFCMIRERHVGNEKDWMRIVAEAVLDAKQYEQMLLDKVSDMAETKSSIYAMTEEDAIRYIKDKLNTSKKMAREVLTCYNTTYGAFSKWDLCNAITDVAHKVENIDARLLFESRAMKVA